MDFMLDVVEHLPLSDGKLYHRKSELASNRTSPAGAARIFCNTLGLRFLPAQESYP